MYPDASGHTLQSRARFFVGTLRDHLGLHMESWNMARKERQHANRWSLLWHRVRCAAPALIWHLCFSYGWATTVDSTTASVATPGKQDSQLVIAGVTVIPHVGASGVRFSRAPIAPPDTRVQLFLHNRPGGGLGAADSFAFGGTLFNSKDATTLVKEGLWSWHDSPEVWEEAQRTMPPDSLVVWSFNSIGKLLGGTLKLDVGGREGQSGQSFDVPIQAPNPWLSAVAFLGPEDSLYPDEMVLYVRNETEHVFRIVDCRLFLPRTPETWRALYANGWLGDKVRSFSEGGRIEPSGLSGARVLTGRLPPDIRSSGG